MCCGCLQTDEDGDIYMSVMQLRDQTKELQTEIDRRKKAGETRDVEKYQQQLTRMQQQLLEKNKIRSVGFLFDLSSLFLCNGLNRETVIPVSSKQKDYSHFTWIMCANW